MNSKINSHKDLEIWKKSIDLVVKTYKLTSSFPEHEKFGLVNQMRRASVSVSSNIAEGSGRISDKEFNRFLEISLGSSFELETQLIIAHELEFLPDDDFTNLSEKVQEEQKMITGLQKSLR